MFNGIIKALQNDSSPMIKESGLTRPLETRSFISCSTLVLGVVDAPPVHSAILVPCAVTLPMDVHAVPYNIMFPIVMKLKPDTWEIALDFAGALHEFINIPQGLQTGFLVGLKNFDLSCTFIPKNHYTLPADEELLMKKYDKEDHPWKGISWI